MSKKRNKIRPALALVLVNIAAILVLLYACEVYLLFTDPQLKLPVDGVVDGRLYTWGHEVVNNRYGFREREFEEPKPKGVFRVMVLGDSFTWGAGLVVADRYTDILERMLSAKFPQRRIEVLNFGIPGGPTVKERDILLVMKDAVEPDLVIVGFCLNDTQPKSQDYSVERARFDKKHGWWLNGTSTVLEHAGLLQMGKVIQKAAYRLAEVVGAVPRWEVALQRTYEPDSRQWREFLEALRDIKAVCDEAGLAAPIFVVLNQGTGTDRPTDYANPDDELKLYLRWYHQAEHAAAQIGFVTCNFEREIAAELSDKVLAVNVVDVHPPKELNEVYARKMFELVAPHLAKIE